MKYLVLRILQSNKATIDFRIDQQSHTWHEFNDRKGYFIASNNYQLDSCNYPEWDDYDRTLYIRGTDEWGNNKIVTIPKNRLVSLETAINEYNAYYGYRGKSIITNDIIPMDLFKL